MARGHEIAEIHEVDPSSESETSGDGSGYVEFEYAAETAPVSQAEIDAEALNFPSYAASDANAVQDMLEQSLRNELKASKAYNKWKTEQGSKGKALLDACTEHRQRTSRLYRLLTDGIDGISA